MIKKLCCIVLIMALTLVCACDYIPQDIGLIPGQDTPMPIQKGETKDSERVFSGIDVSLYPLGAQVVTAAANLYARPDATSEIITQMESGTAVTIISASGEWYEVKVETLSGYVKITSLRAVESEKPRLLKSSVGGLVNMRVYNPSVQVNMLLEREGRWGAPIYTANVCALTKRAADKLSDVQKELSKQGKGIKILDAYRDEQAQAHLLARSIGHVEINRGATHRSGSAVDVTLVDAAGRELPMPTLPYDANNAGSQSGAQDNARILKEAMLNHGFVGASEAWWHFEEDNASSMPLLNVLLSEFLP